MYTIYNNVDISGTGSTAAAAAAAVVLSPPQKVLVQFALSSPRGVTKTFSRGVDKLPSPAGVLVLLGYVFFIYRLRCFELFAHGVEVAAAGLDCEGVESCF